MAHIVKVVGRAKIAHLDGLTIERQDRIYVPSHKQWYEQLDTQDHFCFRQEHKFGPALLCTCGSGAGVFHYDAYNRFQSSYVGDVVACISLMQYCRHADGSTS
jgi:hypothetical protein